MSDEVEQVKMKINPILVIVCLVGIASLCLGVIVGNTSYVNFPEETDDYSDYKDAQFEQDISGMQYLIGAVFINIGIGLILIFLFAGLVANDTLKGYARLMFLIIAVSALIIWIYFALLSGMLSHLTYNDPGIPY
jgi:uncharacterized oligopeptide transporter (OPT) family protein